MFTLACVSYWRKIRPEFQVCAFKFTEESSQHNSCIGWFLATLCRNFYLELIYVIRTFKYKILSILDSIFSFTENSKKKSCATDVQGLPGSDACSGVAGYWCFRDPCCFHLQGVTQKTLTWNFTSMKIFHLVVMITFFFGMKKCAGWKTDYPNGKCGHCGQDYSYRTCNFQNNFWVPRRENQCN